MTKQKVVIKASMEDAKKRSKVLEIVAKFHGVSTISEENGQITVVGDGIDPVRITMCIRKKTCNFTELVSVGPVEEKKKEEEKKPSPPPVCCSLQTPLYYCYETYPRYF